VSLDPWGHVSQLIFKKEIDEGCDIRPSIAVTKAHILVPELLENIAKGVIRVDNDVNISLKIMQARAG
jgi:hypothetical protein